MSVSKPKLSHTVKFKWTISTKKKPEPSEASSRIPLKIKHLMSKKRKLTPHTSVGKKARLPLKFLPLKNKKNKNFNGTCLGLAFLQRVSQCGACIPLLAFFVVLAPVSRCVGSVAIWRSPEYIMPVIGSRNTKAGTTEKKAAYNLHYVNIALGTVFPGVPFCMSAQRSSCRFCFASEDLIHTKTKAGMCCRREGQKA